MANPFRLALFLAATIAVLVVGSSVDAIALPSDAERRDFCEGSKVEILGPSFLPKIGLVRKVFLPGEVAYARLENHGSGAIYFGYAYGVERFVDGRWIEAPDPPGPFLLPLFHMGAGETGACITYRISSDVQAGAFRFVEGVSSEDHRRRVLRAGFRVANP